MKTTLEQQGSQLPGRKSKLPYFPKAMWQVVLPGLTPCEYSELRLVDPVTLKDVASGEEGELWVKGPQTMM
jgi:acyl-CoA synthetase (AMP-forming)/AMP-acid ligase II